MSDKQNVILFIALLIAITLGGATSYKEYKAIIDIQERVKRIELLVVSDKIIVQCPPTYCNGEPCG
jgi:hypothetical protein